MFKIKKEIQERVKSEANYILKTELTIREIAKKYQVSKSTVHKDLQSRLKDIDKNLFMEVDNILKKHIYLRHIRGGESTRKKYLNIKKSFIWLSCIGIINPLFLYKNMLYYIAMIIRIKGKRYDKFCGCRR